MRGILVAIAGVWLLLGCASAPKPVAPARNPTELRVWDMRASLLARGAQSGRGSLRWEQDEDRFRITVAGPFGVGATRLEGDFDRVVVTRGDQSFISDHPERDMAVAVGAPVPLRALADWIRGMPEPRDLWRAETQWTRGDWVVVVDARQRFGVYDLPVEMRLQGAEQQLQLSRMRWEWSTRGERAE